MIAQVCGLTFVMGSQATLDRGTPLSAEHANTNTSGLAELTAVTETLYGSCEDDPLLAKFCP